MDATNLLKKLTERGEDYGPYKKSVQLRQDLMERILQDFEDLNDQDIDPMHFWYIFDIVNKLVRLAATPTHIDTWEDIAGYALRVVEALTDGGMK